MPDPILQQLRDVGQQIRSAEAEGAGRAQLLALWRRRRDLITQAVEHEHRKPDIARALDISRQRVDALLATSSRLPRSPRLRARLR